MIRLTDTITLADREIKERFVRAFGPGGQNVNKDATAVELRIDIGRSLLPFELKGRLIELARKHVTTDGVLVIVSRAHRSQAQNRVAAHARLVGLLKRAATPPKTRKVTKPAPIVREERLIAKHRHSAVKLSRSRQDED
ncbi:unnamed protein product [uncultured bacterium]|nr:unnamed protein product [uncultured bacterium]